MSLALKKLSLRIADTDICQNLSCTLAPGETLALLGRNGSGKTQLLHCIAGITKPQSGFILLDQTRARQIPRRELAKKMGFLFQENHFELPVRVEDAVKFGRFAHQTKDDDAIVAESISLMALDKLRHRFVGELSGGERRRVQIATLLAQRPDIYLLDEPLNHLDIPFKWHVLTIFKDIAKTQKAIVIASLHDIEAAKILCNKTLCLQGNGETVFGETKSILENKLFIQTGVSHLCDTPSIPDGDF